MRMHYSNLFPDEIAEILRELPDGARIEKAFSVSYRPCSGVLYDDGIISSGAGYFTEYIAGQRVGIVSAGYLLQALAIPEEFDIIAEA